MYITIKMGLWGSLKISGRWFVMKRSPTAQYVRVRLTRRERGREEGQRRAASLGRDGWTIVRK